jgi:hypothetical protein
MVGRTVVAISGQFSNLSRPAAELIDGELVETTRRSLLGRQLNRDGEAVSERESLGPRYRSGLPEYPRTMLRRFQRLIAEIWTTNAASAGSQNVRRRHSRRSTGQLNSRIQHLG